MRAPPGKPPKGKKTASRARPGTSAANKKKNLRAATDRYRAKMKRQGMRLVQFWVPDVNAPGFKKELQRQVRVIAANKEGEKKILDEIEALSAGLDLGEAPDYEGSEDDK
jgi:hypothetical protein